MPVAFSAQAVISGISNPTSLQFGPDGRLYVSQQDGTIQIYTISQPTPGQWVATADELVDLVRNIPNHNDDGSLNGALTDRQVTALLVTGTAEMPVLYVTSSDPRIATGTDANLDTNSGVLSRLTFDGVEWTKVDLIRGLPRSEENHSPNGMALSADGTKLYLAQGGNTNNGAPSLFFSNTPEYALSAALLEIDLVALDAIPDKLFTYGPGLTSVYKYDLPTLDDPTVANNGTAGGETAAGLDVGGPFGGNDGMNQAILPADAPLRIFATGLRNAFDVVMTQDGRLFTIDNGGNQDLGSTPLVDAQNKPTNLVHNGGVGSIDHLYLVEGGGYYGHPDPTRANQTGSVVAYTDGPEPQAYATIANAADAVPDGIAMTPGFVIDPTKFTSDAARLAAEGQFTVGQHSLAGFAASTNGLMEYTADTFAGEIKGDLITASFDGTIKLIHRAADGVTVTGVSTLATPGGIPLDVTQGPDGTLWVTQIGSGQILVLTPADDATAADPDIDGDGLLNTVDRFQADAANGLATFLSSGSSYNWNFQFGAGNSAPGPAGLFLGLTGHMTNGSRDFVAPVAEGGLDLGNVKIGTAAGGGLIVVEEVSNGTASGPANTGEFLFQTGVSLAPDVQSFNVQWTALNPFPGMASSPTHRQIGGFIGTGDQDNFFKLAAGPNGSGNVLFQFESNGVTVASQTFAAAGLLTAPAGSSLVFNLAVNRATSTVTPSITYAGSSGPVTVTGSAVSVAGTAVLDAIDGEFMVQGQASGLAVGLWSSNTGEGSQATLQAAFDDILITAAGTPNQLIKAVNVGGGQFTSSSGIVYEADPGPTTGGAASQVFANSVGIAGTTDDGLYIDERWTPGGSYTYEVAVANGTYRVDLNLAEIYWGIAGPGQRVFDMALEGQALAPLQNVDIYGQVGAFTALTISQQVTVSDGSLSIQVGPGSNAAGNVENAKLNGFAVFGTGSTPTPPSLSIAAASASKSEGNTGSTAFTFTVSRSGDLAATSAASWAVTGSGASTANAADFAGGILPTGTVTFAAGEAAKTVTVNVAGDTTVEPSEGFTVTLSAPTGATIATATATGSILNDDSGGPPQLVKAVNVGGGQVTASNGVVFEADPGPSTGGSQLYFTTAPIAGTTDDALYIDERWIWGGSFTYEVPVANGTYQVDLLFSENSGLGSGQRVFDMALEGQTLAALQNIDISSRVGVNTALTVSQQVTVSDGSLSIQVGPGSSAPGNVDNAKLNAFAVYAAGSTPPAPTLSIAAANASLNEGNSGNTAFTFTVSRAGDLAATSAASWAVTGSGASTANAADFAGGILPTGTVTFAAGEAAKTVTVNVAGDTTVEPSEGFTVTLSAPTGATIATATATGSILNDDASPASPVAQLQITPGAGLNASTFNQPSYELTNTGSVAITSLVIDLHNSLIAGNVFDPFGTFGDTTALDFTPYAAPVPATWTYGPVTEGGYKTLQVTFGSGGLAAGQTFGFRLDADPASIEGPSPGPNEAGSISGFEHIGAAVTVGLANGASHTAEVFTQGTAGGGTATLLPDLLSAPELTVSTTAGVPLATAFVGGVTKANLPGLEALAGSPGNDIVVGITGAAGQTVRLSVSEIGGVGQDIALGSHEGNTVLQAPLFIDVVLGADGAGSVSIALPAETPASSLQSGSVSGRFAITAAVVNPATGAATSLVSSTLVVKDAQNAFTSEAAADTFTFREGFVTTDIFAFAATGANHDLIELDQNLFPGMTVSQFLNSGALTAGAGAGDVDITTSSGAAIQLHDPTGTMTVATLQAHPEDFRFF